MKRIIITIIAVIISMSALIMPAYAEYMNSFSAVETVQPRYTYLNSTSCKLSISGTTATCNSSAVGKSTTTSITAVQTLEKLWAFGIYNEVSGAEWTKTSYSTSITMSNTKSGLSSGTYRLKTVFTVTDSSGTSETVTVYSSTVEI